MRGDSRDRLPAGRHGLSPEQVAENQRWRLLAAAGEVLLARGYRGVTSREICRRAGVSSATFYRHFEDSNACLLAAYTMAVDCVWELVGDACVGAGPWSERLRKALDAVAEFLAAEPPLACLLCADLAAGLPAVGVAQELLLDRLAGLLGAARNPRRQADRLPPRVEAHLTGAAASLLGDRVVAGELDRLPAIAPELLALLSRPYLCLPSVA